jgi:hypothetical protein
VTALPGVSRRALPKVSTHAGFPGLTLLSNGDLLHVWRDAPAHAGGTDGRIMRSFLGPTLRTAPSAPVVLADWANDLRDPSVTASRDGTKVWLTFFEYLPTKPPTVAWSATSTDGGHTFGGFERIDPVNNAVAVTAPVVELANGSLLAFCYGRHSSADAYDSALVYRRDPAGTWSLLAVLASGPADGRHYQEPTAITLRNGALLAAFRYGGKDRIGVSASTDGGATWSAPTPKFAGWGRPSILELSTGPTICVYRAPGSVAPYPALYRVSLDRGGTWGAAGQLDPAPDMWAYGGLVETGPGLVTAVNAIQASETDSTIRALHFADVAT